MMAKCEPKINRLRELSSQVAFTYTQLVGKEKPSKIETMHLLLGMLLFEEEFIADFIENLGSDALIMQINNFVGNLSEKSGEEVLDFDDNCLKMFDFASKVASTVKSEYILIEHLFFAFFCVEDETFSLKEVLQKGYGVDPENFAFAKKELEDYLVNGEENVALNPMQEQPSQLKSLNFCENLTEEALKAPFPPSYPDSFKIDELVNILTRKNKKNPILIGKAGTGKTTLVKTLAYLIAVNKTSEFLVGKTVYSLNLNEMISGSVLRGQFEKKLEDTIQQAVSRENVILFIDEIHTLVGAGDKEGANDAANILKPYLSDGRLSVIGATTFDEYSKIERDKALKRRFSSVVIQEPTESQTKTILKTAIPSFEHFHNLKVESEAIDEIIRLSSRYIHDNSFPDKAFDVLDYACAFAKNAAIKRPAPLTKIEDEIDKIAKKAGSEEEFIKNSETKRKAYEKAITTWQSKLTKIKVFLTKDSVQKAFLLKTGIEVGSDSPKSRIESAMISLKSSIFGQDDAITKLVKSCSKMFLDIGSDSRPIASVIIYGEKDSGKYFIAESIAKCQALGVEKNYVTIDLAEFSSDSSVSSFIGASAGYIGHDTIVPAVQSIKRMGRGVIILKNLNLASSAMLAILKTALTDGKILDNKNDSISVSNFIVLATISGEVEKSLGFNSAEKVKDIKEFFKHSIIDDFDEVVTVKPMDRDSKLKLVKSFLTKDFAEYARKGIEITWEKEVESFIIDKADQASISSSALRLIRKNIIPELNEILLSGEVSSVNIQLKEKGLSFNVSEQNSHRFVPTPAFSKA